MVKKYILEGEGNKITISQSAKEEFKKMMGWSEKEFKEHTRIIEKWKKELKN